MPQGGGLWQLVLASLALVLLWGAQVGAERFGLTEQVLTRVAEVYGYRAQGRLLDWQELVDAYRNEDEATKLEAVNHFFNQVRYRSDASHWGQRDYWATPVELLASNGGDCEDYSIAKYFTLREMGVSAERMRITYVKALELNIAHMVLAYYATPDAEPLVLDNLIDDIKPASRRKDLQPVYSFNGEGLWLAKERAAGIRVGSASRISLWEDLGMRMQNGTLNRSR